MYHVPVRTTTLPLARSAYINNSSSETTVVMALVEGEEQSQGACAGNWELGWLGLLARYVKSSTGSD
jgi:hypothetical protein